MPLYLEWAPGNILNQNTASETNSKNAAIVGEHDAKMALLEQNVKGISEMEVDPDRVEVCHFAFTTIFAVRYIFSYV